MSLLSGPPQMAAVLDNIEANHLISVYEHEFSKAFGFKPIFEPGSYQHITTFKDIYQACKEQADPLVRHFFKMKDEWFQKQGYTPECLKKNLAAIAIDLKNKAPFRHHGPIQFSFMCGCDICFEYFTLTTTQEFLNSNKPRLCLSCTDKTNMEQKG